MCRTAILVLPKTKNLPLTLKGDYFGVDAGLKYLIDHHLPIKQAIGDFDSLPQPYRHYIDELDSVSLPCEKDETDAQVALAHVVALGYEHIIIFGGLQGRMDHMLANLRMIEGWPQVILMDETNRIRYVGVGEHAFKKEYTYISLFATEDSIVTFEGVKYPLDHQPIGVRDFYTVSNEVVDQAKLTIEQGCVIVIESRDCE